MRRVEIATAPLCRVSRAKTAKLHVTVLTFLEVTPARVHSAYPSLPWELVTADPLGQELSSSYEGGKPREGKQSHPEEKGAQLRPGTENLLLFKKKKKSQSGQKFLLNPFPMLKKKLWLKKIEA